MEQKRYLALDCEMVGGRKGSMLAEVAIVDWNGMVVYHSYVQPTDVVVDYRTSVSGITPEKLTPRSGARSFRRVQQEVLELLQGAILVGHALENDLRALGIRVSHVRNTAHHPAFQTMTARGQLQPQRLAALYERYVNVAGIQHESHSAVEDARASMRVYRTYHEEWNRPVEHAGPILPHGIPRSAIRRTNSPALPLSPT